MSEPVPNPYLALGVERSADERAIKKAYFALVRKFPPETHPEEFQKLRAAYELLSDAAARERYDRTQTSYSEYPPAIAERLDAAREAQQHGNEELARTIYRELLAQDARLSVARTDLALLLFRAQKFDEALVELTALNEQEPDNARHQFHRGIVLGRLERPKEAEEALRRALSLESGNTAFRSALAECLSDNGKTAEAVAVVDEGEALLDRKAPARVGLVLRRIEALAAGITWQPELRAAIARTGDLIRDFGDAELPAYLASQLAAVAARLYARERHAEGDEVLAACARIWPAARVERPSPAVRRLCVPELPERAQAWLRAQDPASDAGVIAQMIWPLPILGLLASVGVTVLVWAWIASPAIWTAGDWVASAVKLTLCAAAVVGSIASIAHILASPVRALLTLHPLYLVRARADAVELYSLLHLERVNATHQHTNGVYTATTVRIGFTGAKLGFSIRGKALAERWLNTLYGRRQRALHLLAGGLLEAEHGVDGFTPLELDALPPRGRGLGAFLARRETRALGLAAAILGVLATPVAWYASRRAAEDGALSAALADGSADALGRFLAAHPGGRHRASVEREIEARFDAAEAFYRDAARDGAPGVAGLRDALGRLRAAHRSEVPLGVRIDGADAAGTDEGRAFADWVGRLAKSAELDGVMRVSTGADAEGAPVRMEVTLRSAAAAGYEADRAMVPARSWRGRVALVGARGEVLVAAPEAELGPPATLDLDPGDGRAGGDLGPRVDRALRLAAMARVASDFASAVGLAGVDLRKPPARGTLAERHLPSPYESD